MAIEILWDAYLSVNGVDLSDHVRSIELPRARDIVDKTVMGATSKGKLPGLSDDKFSVTFAQDFAAAKVDATLSPLYDNRTAFAIEIRKDKTNVVSSTNPKWTSSIVYLTEYQPVGGEPGALHEAEASFDVDGALVRATA